MITRTDIGLEIGQHIAVAFPDETYRYQVNTIQAETFGVNDLEIKIPTPLNIQTLFTGS
jgi:hypothetical protein